MDMGQKLFEWSNWIAKFMILNLLWIVFTMLGLGIFGFMPATIAMFTIMRKWIMSEKELPIFATFFKTYKKEFFKSNMYGIAFFGVGYLILLDMKLLHNQSQFYLIALYYILLAVLIIFILTFIVFFPVYVHYNLSFKRYMVQSLILCLVSPIQIVLIVASFAGGWFVFRFIPGLLPIACAIFPCYFVMTVMYRRFSRLSHLHMPSETTTNA